MNSDFSQAIYRLGAWVVVASTFFIWPPVTLGQLPADRSIWEQKVRESFIITSGDLSSARRLVVLVRDSSAASVGEASAPYDTTLEFPVDLSGATPASEVLRLRGALGFLPLEGLAFDIWSEGLAGLIARDALEGAAASLAVQSLVLVDVPHRGLSPSGWPDWRAGADSRRPPPWAVSGSEFLTLLNARQDVEQPSIRYLNVWCRQPDSAPRASVLQLPRSSVSLVVDTPGPVLWNLLDKRIAAIRLTPPGGPLPRAPRSGPAQPQQEALRYGPRRVSDPAPDLRQVLDLPVTTFPAAAQEHWIEFGAEVWSNTPDVFLRFTDIIGAQWIRSKKDLVIVGYEDYFREPLRKDIFEAAISAYRKNYPAISIDPRRPGDPPLLSPVRYEGGLGNTRLGGLMFEADRVMKALSLGKDNISGVPVRSNVPEYRPIIGDPSTSYGTRGTVWRLWFEPARWHAVEPDGLSVQIDARFHINWQKMTSGEAPSAAVERFTKALTERFSEYAVEQPSLDQLDQSAGLMALASWIVDARLRLPPSGTALRFFTPPNTPLVEVSSSGDFGRYRITEVVQGGAIGGIKLNHVSGENPYFQELLKQAIAEVYPPAFAKPPPVVVEPRITRQQGVTPTTAARPPPLTAGFVHDGILYQTAAFSALPIAGARPGIISAKDSLTAPPKTVDAILRQQAVAPHVLTMSVDYAADPPRLALRGTRFGKQRGNVLFEGKPLEIESWADNLVLVTSPRERTSGRLVLQTTTGESNPIDLEVVVSVPEPIPPRVTFINNTDFAIDVAVEPVVFGSHRAIVLPPGARRVTNLVPASYKIVAVPSGESVIVGQKDEARAFKPNYQYELRYEPATFPASKVLIHNRTGKPLTFELGGDVERTLSIPPGDKTLDLAPGNYKVNAKAWCGNSARTLTISRGSVQELTYGCQSR